MFRIAAHIFGIVVVGYLLLPLIIVLGASFTDSSYLAFPPKGLSLKWYKVIFTDPSYVDSIFTSFKLAIITAVCAVIIGVPAAYAISKLATKYRSIISSLFLSPLIIPGIITGIIILQNMDFYGFERTFTGLLIGHLVVVLPYVIRNTLAAVDTYSDYIEDASRDLGANGLTTFFLVVIPLSKSGIVSGAVFAFIISWINVEVSIFNSTSSLIPVPVKIFNYIQYNIDPTIAAVSGYSIIVALVLVLLLDYFVGVEKAASVSNNGKTK